MMNTASTSNPSYTVEVGEAYPYPSHVSAPNFVTVKLSGRNKYNMWKTQMLCLLTSHRMCGFIDGQFPSPAGNGKGKVGDMEAWIISDSLVKGWILGSLSEEAVKTVVNRVNTTVNCDRLDFTAKDLWDELRRTYGPSVHKQAAEKRLTTRQAESGIQVSSISEDAKSKDEPTKEILEKHELLDKDSWKRRLYKSVLEGNTISVINQLKEGTLKPWDKITNNGNTILHVAVGSSSTKHELLEKLLEMTPDHEDYTLVNFINSDGSTLLHVAAIGGNTKAVKMLVERNTELLLATDNEGHIPLALSVSNMHIKTSHCLFQHMNKKGYRYDVLFMGKSGEELVVLAISCQDFSLARMIIDDNDAILPNSDAVLTALSQNFPRELKFWERKGFGEIKMTPLFYNPGLHEFSCTACCRWLLWIFFRLFIGFCALPVRFYNFLIRTQVRLFFGNTFQIHEVATNLLFDVCSKVPIKVPSTYHRYYTSSIFEATRQNSSTFIRCIMRTFPDAIWSTNEDGHNFIQYSVINRSEKTYNLLYEMSQHNNIYKTLKDSSENNLLHLAGRLAPTNKLNLISGAALQIQRELQWFKEVERFVCPLNRIQKNLDDETPDMVFTREHKGLVNQGENWMKKTAESYTITAALIVTIVFAAAITVPGGNNQDSGIPIFTNNTAFTVFAISDAISLFTAVTSLLMFLSILTARFAEQDFLYKLPTKLIIGLTMLFLSTTAMIIAFGATLFLVFGQRNLLMLIPIGALTCLPITSFVTLQCPLIIELISATYGGGIFGREEYGFVFY